MLQGPIASIVVLAVLTMASSRWPRSQSVASAAPNGVDVICPMGMRSFLLAVG